MREGQEIIVTADENADITDASRLAISYNRFADMCQPGDQLFVGRYLVNGADQSSLYLEVSSLSSCMSIIGTARSWHCATGCRPWSAARVCVACLCLLHVVHCLGFSRCALMDCASSVLGLKPQSA